MRVGEDFADPLLFSVWCVQDRTELSSGREMSGDPASSTLGANLMDAEHYVSYLREEVNHEIGRLEAMLRDPRITEEDRDVARAMLKFYEDAKTV